MTTTERHPDRAKRSLRSSWGAIARLVLTLAALVLPLPASSFAAQAETDPNLYFPPIEGEWETVAPAAVGWSAEGLDAALDLAGENASSDVVILYQGRILAERTFEPAKTSPRYRRMVVGTVDGRPKEDVASVQKSLVSLLVGMARGKGLIDLGHPVHKFLGVGWSKASPEREAAITVRHLMSMTTGLGTDLAFEVPAGERWQYNTSSYSLLVPVLEKATGQDIGALSRGWLTNTIAMDDSGWKPRPWVTRAVDANSLGFTTTARDLSRLGLLVLANGIWAGHDVLGESTWLGESLSPSQELNPAFGLLWWLNGQESLLRQGRKIDGPLIPQAPGDLVAALGALGRKLFVVPSMELVVVRLGDQPAPGFQNEFWALLSAAAPQTE